MASSTVPTNLTETKNDDVNKTLSTRLDSTCVLTDMTPESLSSQQVDEVDHLIQTYLRDGNGEEIKENIVKFVEKNFMKSNWKLLFIGILSCPWHHLIDSEHAIVNGHNQLVSVYAGEYIDMYSLEINNEEKGLISHDSMIIFEARLFVKRFLKGLLDVTELLFMDKSMIIKANDEWKTLISSLNSSITDDLGLRSILPFHFVKRCQAHSINVAMKKIKNGQYEFMEPLDLVKLFHSLRLLTHLECLKTKSLILSEIGLSRFINSHSTANDCFETLRKLKENITDSTQKKKLLQLMVDWNTSYESISNEGTKLNSNLWLQNWIVHLRLGMNLDLSPSLSLITTEGEVIVKEILETLVLNCNCPQLKDLDSNHVLLATQFGSSLYNVSVRCSDTDYMLVFSESANKFITKDFIPVRSLIECRGPTMDIEFTAYEISKVAECLLKGSVNLLELVFIDPDHLQWAGQAWRYLHEHAKSQFLSEMAITQFMGYAKTHLKRLENDSLGKIKQPGKMLYHIRHKLNSVRSMLASQIPQIRLYGSERDWIIGAREIADVQTAIQLGSEEVNSVKSLIHSRSKYFHKNVDPKFLQSWISMVKG